MELFDDIAYKKINNALIVTESLIQQVNQNIKLLKNFQKINPRKKNVVLYLDLFLLRRLLTANQSIISIIKYIHRKMKQKKLKKIEAQIGFY